MNISRSLLILVTALFSLSFCDDLIKDSKQPIMLPCLDNPVQCERLLEMGLRSPKNIGDLYHVIKHLDIDEIEFINDEDFSSYKRTSFDWENFDTNQVNLIDYNLVRVEYTPTALTRFMEIGASYAILTFLFAGLEVYDYWLDGTYSLNKVIVIPMVITVASSPFVILSDKDIYFGISHEF